MSTGPGTPPLANALLDPFGTDEFRSGLASLGDSVRAGWQRWAQECLLLAELAGQVPREPMDARGGTAWTSFLREIAVTRRCSDQAAAKEVLIAVALVSSHPRTLELLQAGKMPQYSARVLIEESLGLPAAAIAEVEAELAERACRLAPRRILDAVRRIELRHDADAAAVRSAKAATGRGVRLQPQRDGQASLMISGPALPVVQFYAALTAQARAARLAGDPRGVDALRFDLAVAAVLPSDPPPVAATTPAVATEPVPRAPALTDDRRCSRPIQANIQVPVSTALGLSNEPGWLDGYGWISAPQCREWLPLSELRQVCVSPQGQIVDAGDRWVRPASTPQGVRDALVVMVDQPFAVTPKTYESESRHDPSRALAEFVDLRDVICDGPTGRRVIACRADHDHEVPYPDGPTAAWNLTPRARRTHVLKHRGWSPLRTATSTIWFSPAGQIVEVERWSSPPPEIDPDAELPDPDDLHEVDAELLREPTRDDQPPPYEPPPF